jgi:hypothetical protein
VIAPEPTGPVSSAGANQPPNGHRASTRFGLTVLVATLVAFGLVLALLAWRTDDSPGTSSSTIDGIESTTADADAPPQRDLVGSLACGAELGVLRANGSVTNHSTGPADYTIAVQWTDGGAVLGRGTTQLQRVGIGQSRSFDLTSPGTGISSMSCRITRVDRVAVGS